MHVESELAFLDLWSAANAQAIFSETPMETVQGWFDDAGVGISLTRAPQALVVRQPQPDVLWSATVPGTRALSNLWIIALSATLLGCVVWCVRFKGRNDRRYRRNQCLTPSTAGFIVVITSFLLFLILIGVWRSRMAPIYDGVAYTPYVSAPPPPPPPISGFMALNYSLGMLDLARRKSAAPQTLVFPHPLSSLLINQSPPTCCDRYKRTLRRGLHRRAVRLLRAWTLHELKVCLPHVRRRRV